MIEPIVVAVAAERDHRVTPNGRLNNLVLLDVVREAFVVPLIEKNFLF